MMADKTMFEMQARTQEVRYGDVLIAAQPCTELSFHDTQLWIRGRGCTSCSAATTSPLFDTRRTSGHTSYYRDGEIGSTSVRPCIPHGIPAA
jgi:hypothetical protein